MALDSLQIIALILIVVSTIKLIVIIFNPMAWYKNVVKKVYRPHSTWIFLILALIVLYYLIQSEITITIILAVTTFIALLFGLSFSIFSKELLQFADKIYKSKDIIKRSWLSIIIWIILLLWGFLEIFGLT